MVLWLTREGFYEKKKVINFYILLWTFIYFSTIKTQTFPSLLNIFYAIKCEMKMQSVSELLIKKEKNKKKNTAKSDIVKF